MLRACCIIIAVITSAACLNASAALPVRDPKRTGANVTKLHNATSAIMPMSLAAPLFIEDEAIESELTLVSDSPTALDVSVVLSALSGSQLVTTTITMGPHTQQRLKVSDLLATSAFVSSETYGSILLTTQQQAPLAVQLSIRRRDGLSNSVEEEFAMLMDPQPANYRAVIGDVSNMPLLAVRSISDAEQAVSISCLVDTEHLTTTMRVAPNQTILTRACREVPPPGGRLRS